MTEGLLPKEIRSVQVPPIKCQGIKTKLVPFIGRSIRWHGRGRWIEPFLGSGVVALNLAPTKARLSDTNRLVIDLYRAIQSDRIDEHMVRERLQEMGTRLRTIGEDYFYEVRKRLNADGDPLDLLFLNRSCFNGIMRFNAKGHYNVPFGKKPERFRPAYITKIVNQVRWLRRVLHQNEWEFACMDWRDCLNGATEDDFVYLDPPYIGRHTDYYNRWTDDDARELAHVCRRLPCGFALSMWKQNKYRENPHIAECWPSEVIRTTSHFYHVGSTESLRNEMIEALVIRPGSAVELDEIVAAPVKPRDPWFVEPMLFDKQD